MSLNHQCFKDYFFWNYVDITRVCFFLAFLQIWARPSHLLVWIYPGAGL